MRPIKYRQFINGVIHYWGVNIKTKSGNNMTFVAPVDAQKPSYQFTGLTDKNGVEIYEGDVVRFSGVNWHDEWIVEWAEGKTFGYSWIGFAPPMPADRHTMEVIDNVHQNPELMGGDDA